ncbi:MAG: hypothetical protein ACSHWS_00665 [Sulfitobacter sp.]
MTEIKENTARQIPWVPFLSALIAAPLLITALTFWITIIPYFALIMGGPIYLLFGTPILIWHLRRHPPRVLPIVLLALISLLGLIPIALIIWAITGDDSVMEALLAFLIYGAGFAAIWSATFVLIYQRLI